MLSILTKYILFFAFLLPQYSGGNNSIKIIIQNTENVQGQLIIGLCNSVESFPKKPFRRKIVKLEKGKIPIIIFKNLKVGEYAFTIIHDANSNGKLDFHFWGPPSEKTYASNNAKGIFGPPSWEDAKFSVSEEDSTIQIKL